MISYAQNLEDVVLNRLFRNKKSGFYIDVGASDPVEMSVTKHFYDLGWSGINIEPVHSGFTRFQELRPRDINLNLAVGTMHDFREIFEIEGYPEYSSLDRKIAEAASVHTGSSIKSGKIEVQTLAAICEEYCRGFIDFLKIDTEGMETEVIKGADWKKFRPTMLAVEASEPCASFDPAKPLENSSWQEWEPILLDAGYILVYDDTLNRYYLRKEDEHLRIRFAFPVNPVRDEFVFYAQVREAEVLELEKKELIAELGVLAGEKQHLEEARTALEDSIYAAKEECESLRRALLEKSKESADWTHEIEVLKKEEVLLRTELGKTSDEKENVRSELEEKKIKCDSLDKEVERLKRDRNRQAVELKELRPLTEKLKTMRSELELMKHVLLDKQFRADHRARCFLERFIPFIPWPESLTVSSPSRVPSVGFVKAEERKAAVSSHKIDSHIAGSAPFLVKPTSTADKIPLKVYLTGLDISSYEDYSRFGMTARHWSAAMESLVPLRDDNSLFFTPSVSAAIFRNPGNPQPIKRPWIGIIQEPHTIPDWLAAIPGCGGAPWLFKQPAWKESMPACRGLFALSKYSAEFLRKQFPEIQVSVITHPADFTGDMWSPERFRDNASKKVIQPGWYLRNLHSIYELPQTQAEKVAVPFCQDRELYQQLFEAEDKLRKSKGLFFESMKKTGFVMDDVSEAELGRLLTENIAFVNLYESNAVDTVIECIATATPLLVNAMPAVVEYLGPGYPFYMWCYDQAAEKVEDHKLILETHDYLKGLDIRTRMVPQAFRQGILESEICRAALETTKG